MSSTIHDRFSLMLKALDLNAFNFAKRLNIAPAQIYNICNGRNSPSFGMLANIAETFPQVNLTWLLTGKGHPPIYPIGAQPVQVESTENEALKKKLKALEDQIDKIKKPEVTPEMVAAALQEMMVKKKKK